MGELGEASFVFGSAMKRKKPLISVIIPAYNEEKYIHSALSSIKAQSFKDYEIIVVADSCTDRTAEVAKSFGCRVIKVKTRNVGKNRNIGAGKAKADILVFLDADVKVSRGYLRDVHNAVKKGYGCGRPYYFSESSNFIMRNLWSFNNIARLQVYIHTWFVTKKCFKLAGGFPENFNNCMDESEFSEKVNKVCKGCVVDAKAFNSDRRFKEIGLIREIFLQLDYAFRYIFIYKFLGIKVAPSWPQIR